MTTPPTGSTDGARRPVDDSQSLDAFLDAGRKHRALVKVLNLGRRQVATVVVTHPGPCFSTSAAGGTPDGRYAASARAGGVLHFEQSFALPTRSVVIAAPAITARAALDGTIAHGRAWDGGAVAAVDHAPGQDGRRRWVAAGSAQGREGVRACSTCIRKLRPADERARYVGNGPDVDQPTGDCVTAAVLIGVHEGRWLLARRIVCRVLAGELSIDRDLVFATDVRAGVREVGNARRRGRTGAAAGSNERGDRARHSSAPPHGAHLTAPSSRMHKPWPPPPPAQPAVRR
jgi:hypothetical protein